MQRRMFMVVAAIAVTFGAWSWSSPTSHGASGGCEGLVIPQNSAHRVAIDPEAGLLHIEWSVGPTHPRDAGIHAGSIDRNVTVAYKSPDCQANPFVVAEATRALGVADEIRQGDCVWMRDFITSGETTLRGEVVNRAAGIAFLANEC